MMQCIIYPFKLCFLLKINKGLQRNNFKFNAIHTQTHFYLVFNKVLLHRLMAFFLSLHVKKKLRTKFFVYVFFPFYSISLLLHRRVTQTIHIEYRGCCAHILMAKCNKLARECKFIIGKSSDKNVCALVAKRLNIS